MFVIKCALAFISGLLLLALGAAQSFDETEIHGYHFHTYYFQTKAHSINEAKELRVAIQEQIDNGFLKNCRMNHFNEGPVGPHPIGSFETCCNSTSISTAMSWFMLNHGNLTILLHPLTRWEVIDHTDRAMFFGASHGIDISVLSEDLEDRLDLCLPLVEEGDSTSTPGGDDSAPTPGGAESTFASSVQFSYLFLMTVVGAKFLAGF